MGAFLVPAIRQFTQSIAQDPNNIVCYYYLFKMTEKSYENLKFSKLIWQMQ